MPVIGWAFLAILVAIAIPGIGQITAVLVMFLLAVPLSAVFMPILWGVSAMGFDSRTTETMTFTVSIALPIVTAGVLLFLLTRLEVSDGRRAALANALVIVIGIPICMGAAYFRARGMFG